MKNYTLYALAMLLTTPLLFGVKVTTPLDQYTRFIKSDAATWTPDLVQKWLQTADTDIAKAKEKGIFKRYKKQIEEKWQQETARRTTLAPAPMPAPVPAPAPAPMPAPAPVCLPIPPVTATGPAAAPAPACVPALSGPAAGMLMPKAPVRPRPPKRQSLRIAKIDRELRDLARKNERKDDQRRIDLLNRKLNLTGGLTVEEYRLRSWLQNGRPSTIDPSDPELYGQPKGRACAVPGQLKGKKSQVLPHYPAGAPEFGEATGVAVSEAEAEEMAAAEQSA